ncbi:ABC transporter substrate-binding protein [Microlunatus speluncae]|uniref:ABC transporter substrate-binding protein n=1 Tax=Microlunatus speluncae TaxID=2594267 RepID=UPI001266398B|nr:ABC transporter substrate-binding protein [Microlunatus speluncae]
MIRPLRSTRIALAVLLLGLFTAVAGCAGPSAGPDSAPPGTAPAGAGFPVTLQHKFGSTTIPEQPQRVVTVGFNDQDFALALGVEPVGVREFLGYPAPDRPWAPENVRGKQLPTVGAQDLDLEQVAKLEPDLILGINSYIDEEAYGLLNGIAPTLAQTADHPDGATPWDEQTRQTGQALGRVDEAAAIIERTTAAFDTAKAAHPEFAGKRAAFLLGSSASGVWSMGADDYRTGWLTQLGFAVDATGGEVSYEKLDTLDRDVLLGEGVAAADLKRDVVQRLAVVREGRYVGLGAFDNDFAAALGFNSPLSLPFLLDIAVPRLAAATDGDPATRPAAYPE